MKKYVCTISRTVYGDLVVRAENENQAREKAIDEYPFDAVEFDDIPEISVSSVKEIK